MPTLTRTQTRRQPIAHRRFPLAAHERLIGREPKALRVHQSSKIGPGHVRNRAETEKSPPPLSRFHTQNAPPNQIYPHEILLIKRQNPLPNASEGHI